MQPQTAENLKRAERHLGQFAAHHPRPAAAWNLLEHIYTQQKRPRELHHILTKLLAYMRTLLPKARAGKEREEVEKEVALYERKTAMVKDWMDKGGPAPWEREGGTNATGGAPGESGQRLLNLDIMLDKDVEKRRAFFKEWRDIGPKAAPGVMVAQFHPRHEPDPLCRMYLAQILVRVGAPQVAPHLALGMWDPDPAVRLQCIKGFA